MLLGKDKGDFLKTSMLAREPELVEEELAGEFTVEGQSTRTSHKRSAKRGGDFFNTKKWVGFLAGMGLLLAAGGSHLSQKVQAYSTSRNIMEVPTLYSQVIETQQDELTHNLTALQEMWLIAPEDARVALVRKLFSYTQHSFDDAAVATGAHNFDVAFSFFLIPAAALQDAPLPVSKKEETSLRRQLALVNCSLKAAQEHLRFLVELKDSQKKREAEDLPSLEQLMAPEADLVCYNGLMQMLIGEADTATADEEAFGRTTARIPRVLAAALANAVADTSLKAAAAQRVNAAFAPLLVEHEDTDLSVLAGGRFRTAAFIGLLNRFRTRKDVLNSFSWQAMMQLGEAFSVETAVRALNQISVLEKEEEEIRTDLIGEALKTPAGEVAATSVEDEGFYRAVLGLFDLGE